MEGIEERIIGSLILISLLYAASYLPKILSLKDRVKVHADENLQSCAGSKKPLPRKQNVHQENTLSNNMKEIRKSYG
jgi:hypothetical protein